MVLGDVFYSSDTYKCKMVCVCVCVFQARILLKPLVSLIGSLVACSARISVDTLTERQTDRKTNYRNPRCACVPRVNKGSICPSVWLLTLYLLHKAVTGISWPHVPSLAHVTCGFPDTAAFSTHATHKSGCHTRGRSRSIWIQDQSNLNRSTVVSKHSQSS